MDYQTIQKIIMAILLVGELIVGSGGDNTPKRQERYMVLIKER